MDRRAVIIGSGITGALTACELTAAGWAVTVLEAAHVGAGSSSRTAAGIRQQFSTPQTVRGMRYAVRYYLDFPERVGGSQVPLVQNGYLFLYDEGGAWADARANVDMQRRAGLDEVEALEAGALVDRFPWIDAGAVLGGTWCPTDGFLLPHVVYQEAIEAARRRGAEVVQRAPVTGASTSGGRITAVHTPRGSYSGDVVLDCTNAWTRRTGRILGGEELEVDPLKRYLWFLARDGSMTPLQLASMPLTIGPSGIYCRPENAETLLIGKKHAVAAEIDFDYDDQDEVEPSYHHASGVEAVPYAIWMELAGLLPPVGEFAGFQATTAGYYGTTPDHNPFLGYDRRLANLVRLVGFSGHGAMFGPFTARVGLALAEAGRDVPSVILDGSPVELDAFRIGRAFSHSETMVI